MALLNFKTGGAVGGAIAGAAIAGPVGAIGGGLLGLLFGSQIEHDKAAATKPPTPAQVAQQAVDAHAAANAPPAAPKT